MFKNFKDALKSNKEYKEAKKAITLMLLNQYSDLLEAEKLTKDAELKAYESMSVFGETFKPDDLQNMILNVNKIASNPKLTSEYYKSVHNDAQKEKNSKAAK